MRILGIRSCVTKYTLFVVVDISGSLRFRYSWCDSLFRFRCSWCELVFTSFHMFMMRFSIHFRFLWCDSAFTSFQMFVVWFSIIKVTMQNVERLHGYSVVRICIHVSTYHTPVPQSLKHCRLAPHCNRVVVQRPCIETLQVKKVNGVTNYGSGFLVCLFLWML